MKKKKNTTGEELCHGYAKEFCEYINYTRNLSFEQDPDYQYLRNLFTKVLDDSKINREVIEFDWERKSNFDTKSKSTMNTTKHNKDSSKVNNSFLLNSVMKNKLNITTINKNDSIILPQINNNRKITANALSNNPKLSTSIKIKESTSEINPNNNLKNTNFNKTTEKEINNNQNISKIANPSSNNTIEPKFNNSHDVNTPNINIIDTKLTKNIFEKLNKEKKLSGKLNIDMSKDDNKIINKRINLSPINIQNHPILNNKTIDKSPLHYKKRRGKARK